jgi:hypothetical protein
MDASACENILTGRANHWHHCIIAQFLKSPMALPDGHFGAMTGQKSRQLKLRHSPQRMIALRVGEITVSHLWGAVHRN